MTTARWRRVCLMAAAAGLALMSAACSSGVAAQADDTFAQLRSAAPWPLEEEPGSTGVCSKVTTRVMCGPYLLKVRTADSIVLSELPEVIRSIGFTTDVRTDGCRGCPREPTVSGTDAEGYELAVTVYPTQGGGSVLDAYLSEPEP